MLVLQESGDQRLLASKVSTARNPKVARKEMYGDQRLLASKVSTGRTNHSQHFKRIVINAYWHQRFQQEEYQ